MLNVYVTCAPRNRFFCATVRRKNEKQKTKNKKTLKELQWNLHRTDDISIFGDKLGTNPRLAVE